MTSWRKHYYLSDLCPGDYVYCQVGVLWKIDDKISSMVRAAGMRGIILDSNGEDVIIMNDDGTIDQYIDHHNEPTRWCFVEDLI